MSASSVGSARTGRVSTPTTRCAASAASARRRLASRRPLADSAFVPTRLPGEASGPEATRFDPHWWHDPRNVEAAVRAIRASLVALDPSHGAAYTRRASAYLAQLHALASLDGQRGNLFCLDLGDEFVDAAGNLHAVLIELVLP